ncbi:MAG: hypothetical protein M2R45_00338 [Verrucomicrobia subdivision 3 bacterium]|nr:hypothetical protein [Limisphaerales bacterium]MCS1412904.1 hypothetical protein [Limisphaerales bacterium]
MIGLKGDFLKSFEDIWLPLVGEHAMSFESQFHIDGYYSAPLPMLSNQELVVLNSVLFDVNYCNCYGDCSDTTATDQLNWLALTLAYLYMCRPKSAPIMRAGRTLKSTYGNPPF